MSAVPLRMFVVCRQGGLAVADVKEYRMNAKRQHLRARIGVVLGFQARLGGLCETVGTIIRQLSKNAQFMTFWEKFKLIPLKYHLQKLEIRCFPINIPHYLNPSHFVALTPLVRREGISIPQPSASASTSATMGLFEQVFTETGYYFHHDTTRDDSLFNEEENTRLVRKTEEIRDAIEESGTRTYNEMRKMALSLQNELEDIKRRLAQP